MRLALDHKLNWIVPIPVPWPMRLLPVASSTDDTACLALDLCVTDGQVRQLAQTTVHSGTVVFERGMWSRETPDQG